MPLAPLPGILLSLLLSAVTVGDVPFRLPLRVEGGGGRSWTLDPDVGVRGDDRFDEGGPSHVLRIDDALFPPTVIARRAAGTMEYSFGPATLGSLEVTRRLFIVPSGPALVRFLELLHNPTAKPVTAEVVLEGQPRPIVGVVASSSGDTALSAADHWFVADTGLPVAASPDVPRARYFALSNEGAPVGLSDATFERGRYRLVYEVEVPPRQTVTLLHFLGVASDRDEARAQTEALVEVDAPLLAGISPALAATIATFRLPDRDRDGISDVAETSVGYDPDDPRDAERDDDGDGLTNREELALGTNPASADGDRDGLPDDEEIARGLDPNHADSDGDGLEDGVETDSGLFVSPSDTGTDPLQRDSDGGGTNDRIEVEFHLDPLQAADDPALHVLAWHAAPESPYYQGMLEHLRRQGLHASVSETATADAARFASELESADAFLFPGDNDVPLTTALSAALADFIERGGVLIAVGPRAGDFLGNAGLLEHVGVVPWMDESPLSTSTRDHSLFRGTDPLALRPDEVAGLSEFSDTDADTLLSFSLFGALRSRAIVEKELGYGTLYFLGFAPLDQNWHDPNATRILLNALEEGYGARDRDADGVLDSAEIALGLDPDDPADGEGDLDGDGLTNAEESRAGSALELVDTDGDGIGDGDEVAQGTDPIARDTDGDGVEDPLDPFPAFLLRGRLRAPRFALREGEAPVDALVVGEGDAPPDVPLQFALTASASAVILPPAELGTILSGAGTGRAVIEASSGRARVQVHTTVEEWVRIGIDDPSSLGITRDSVYFTDFEERDEGFVSSGSGADWEWGVWPGANAPADDGGTAWYVELEATADGTASSYLVSPVFWGTPIPLSLSFGYAFAGDCCCASVSVEASFDDRPFLPLPIRKENPRTRASCDPASPGFRTAVAELQGTTSRIQLRFLVQTHVASGAAIVAVDDIRLGGVEPATVLFLEPDGDRDGDGASNRQELERGTRPDAVDSDGDGLLDPVETDTGVYVGPADTGTDPLDADTDDDGIRDSLELRFGTDLLAAADGFVPFPQNRFELTVEDSFGFVWGIFRNGSALPTIEMPDPLLRSFSATVDLLPIPPADEEAAYFLIPGGGGVVATPENPRRNVEGSRWVDIRDGFRRSLEILENRTAEPRNVTLRVQVGLGYNLPLVVTSGDGDRVWTAADTFIAFRDGWNQQPASAFVFFGEGADQTLTAVATPLGFLSSNLEYELEIPPFETVVVAHFALLRDDAESAIAAARELARSPATGLSGIPSFLRARVVNLPSDTDLDGIPDGVERAAGLDPHDASDAGLDQDQDGLTNLEELIAGTGIALADSDDDGVVDPRELEQGLDPRRADTDGDGALDGVDPLPLVVIGALVDAPPHTLVGASATVRITLSEEARELADRPEGVPFALALAGSARFGSKLTGGRLVEGAGTGRIAIEATSTTLEVEVTDAVAESLELRLEQGERAGIVQRARTRFDFEHHGAGFESAIHEDETWSWGTPPMSPGPGMRKVWSTNLDARPIGRVFSRLETPAITLPPSGRAVLRLLHAFHASCCCETRGVLALATGDGDFFWRPDLGPWSGNTLRCEDNTGGYRWDEMDLTPFAGQAVRFQFVLTGHSLTPSEGWSIAAMEVLADGRIVLSFLDPAGDLDGDGSSNSEELERTTDPAIADTDRDGLVDGVESGSGVFRDLDDTGTDPLESDSDRGGSVDGFELDQALDPFDPADDFVPFRGPSVLLTDGDGTRWTIDTGGGVVGDTATQGLLVSVEGEFFGPPVRSMLQPATQTLFLGPLTIAGLEVSRLVFAPSTGPGFLRYLDLFHNPTAEVAVREILWEQPLSQWFLFEELKLETSSGDSLFRPDDDWITLALPPRDGLPYLSFVMANEERRSTRAFVSITDSIFVRRNVVLEPGETVAFLHFLARDPTAASAREKVAALSRLAGRARDGLSATRAEQIRNFGSDLGSFLRGDTNQDGIVDITDALETLRFLFAGGVEVHCLDAADTDDDGNVDLADAFGTLAFLFLGTLPPQSPGPRSCGADPTEDSLFECRYTTSACPD